MAIRGSWRPYAYNCIFVVYTKKNQGKYFFIREKSGNYQGISFLDFCGHPASGHEVACLVGSPVARADRQ